ncbi:S-layer protein domain-containing protein [Methanosarcina sp. Z-7115]|uniref:S-layer protein domain-containing protein n=1 Tax=Methanosarcina baikalica TaxID=3073890 RepID=A0ABU2D209_9EURY|nr:S-layer protein domain-containing protein [Methanosarcina sp. Z-7115]MDR7666009.1 S-layer protein domain-containing protein [Methanosarcina sp. Z-7115]
MLLVVITPVKGAIEQRGPLISIAAGEHTILNGENCPGLYYSTSAGTYYESLELNFSEDGLIDTGNATYTSKITSGSTAFFGKKYKVFEDGLITENLVSYGSRDLQRGNDYDLGNGYKLVLTGINEDSALLELQKNSLPVTSKSLVKGSKFNFTAEINGTEYVILEGTLKQVLDSKDPIVSLSSVNQYSSAPIEINVGDQYGNFEVTEFTDNKIELKNRVPIRMSPGDYVTILEDLIDFRVADDVYRACSYNMTKDVIKSYQIKGTSITVNRSDSIPDSCVWTADSFGMLYYDLENNFSTESLELNLDAKNDWIPEGGLVYESSPVRVLYKNPEMKGYGENAFEGGYSAFGWDGEKYAYLGNNQGIIHILMDDDKDRRLYSGEEWDLGEGYTLKVDGIDSDKVYLTVLSNNVAVYSSIISPGNSADLGTHTLLYNKTINGIEIPLFSVYVENVLEGNESSGVNLKYPLHFSESPLEIKVGEMFGALTVVETSPRIRLENENALNFGSDLEVTEEIHIGSFEKTTGGNLSVTFFPFMDRVEKVDSVLPATSQRFIPAMSVEEYLIGN